MFELWDSSNIISAAPHLLAILAPEYNLLDTRNVGDTPSGFFAMTHEDSLIHQIRLKLSLALFLIVS